VAYWHSGRSRILGALLWHTVYVTVIRPHIYVYIAQFTQLFLQSDDAVIILYL